jgi:putative aldouronate transport system permease protein
MEVVISLRSKIGDFVIVVFCLLLIVVCLAPVLHIAARSLSSSQSLIRDEVSLWPIGFNIEAYKHVLADGKYSRALWWTAIITVIGTFLSLFMTTLCAYPLTFDKLRGRKFLNTFIIFTMFFNAGTIPTYLLLRDVHLLNQPAVLVIPFCLSVFNMILMRSYLKEIPDSLRESAEIDGAGPITILVNIYLPMATPVMATLALFYAVGRWNGFSDALMFMPQRNEYYPIQLLLYNLITARASVDVVSQEGGTLPGLSESLKAAAIMFATVPILIVYPWLQRYFIAGVTLGAEKG